MGNCLESGLDRKLNSDTEYIQLIEKAARESYDNIKKGEMIKLKMRHCGEVMLFGVTFKFDENQGESGISSIILKRSHRTPITHTFNFGLACHQEDKVMNHMRGIARKILKKELRENRLDIRDNPFFYRAVYLQ